MVVFMFIWNKVKPSKKSEQKSTVEKYCNDKSNDERRMIANWKLIHDDNERKSRGQKGFM